MLKIKELINELNHDNIEYKKLSEISLSISSGLNPRNNFKLNTLDAKNFYVTTKEINKNKVIFSNKTDLINDDAIKIIQKRSNLEIDDILISCIGTIGKVAIVNFETNNWNCSESIMLIKPNKEIIYPKFLTHFLMSSNVQKDIMNFSIGSTLKGIRKTWISNLLIPIIPIKTQKQIANILDKFSDYQAELEAELVLRKKQYEYYRNKLLNFEGKDNVHYHPLHQITIWNKKFNSVDKTKQKSIVKYNSVSAKELKNLVVENGNVKLLSTGLFDGYTTNELAKDKVNVGEIITLPEGGNANIKYWNGEFVNSLNLICTSSNPKTYNTKYIYYFLKSKNELIESHYRGSNVKHPNMLEILELKVPIPSLEDQNQIVEILDKFSALINDINDGLPKEIELRKKQYEYYRNLLLSPNLNE